MLKELNKLLLRARHRRAAWQRWQRKMPHNRVRRARLVEAGRLVGYGPPEPLPEPELPAVFCRKVTLPSGRCEVVLEYDVIEEAYRLARHPKPSPADLLPLPIREEEVRALFERCRGA